MNPKQPRWRPGHRRLIEKARLPVRSLYRVLISMAMAGAVLTFVRQRRDLKAALPLMIVAWYCVPFLLTVAANRYKIPIPGLCWIYLASGLVIVERITKRRLLILVSRISR